MYVVDFNQTPKIFSKHNGLMYDIEFHQNKKNTKFCIKWWTISNYMSLILTRNRKI